MKMFDAMILKRDLLKDCQLDVQILETSNDGLVLRFMERPISLEILEIIDDFMEKHNLNILFDDGVYFISEQILAPLAPMYSE
jgi:hypothetical protein